MRVFLITGASSGIGAAVARAVAAPDTAIVLHARKNRSGAERAAQAVGASGAQSLIVEGDLATKIRTLLPNVGHIQIAGVPDRHEPDECELDYPYLLKLIDAHGYTGWIGCEYIPRAGTSEGLSWLKRWN